MRKQKSSTAVPPTMASSGRTCWLGRWKGHVVHGIAIVLGISLFCDQFISVLDKRHDWFVKSAVQLNYTYSNSFYIHFFIRFFFYIVLFSSVYRLSMKIYAFVRATDVNNYPFAPVIQLWEWLCTSRQFFIL